MDQEEQAVAVQSVELVVCDPCLAGAGGECHTPGCAFWMHTAPIGDVLAVIRGGVTG